MSEYVHVSVLAKETIEGLNVKPDGVYVDCTLGGGGHSSLVLEKLTTGRLIAIDQDEYAIGRAKQRLSAYGDKVCYVNDNFRNLASILAAYAPDGVDGVMMDLGVSSFQLDMPERGFSYNNDAPLDMRMSGKGKSAYDVVNGYTEGELRRILRDYGDEKFAQRIAYNIVKERETKPIQTTLELAQIIKDSIPMKAREKGHHPAKKSFQAIRIEVNDELAIIGDAISDAVNGLKKGGRLAVISFHSLEDKAVKHAMAENAKGCDCPPSFPVCVCGKKPKAAIITKNAITSSEEELEANPRARSAKLRVAEKL